VKSFIVDKNNYSLYNCGPKAYNLFKLTTEGFNIPSFFCINFSILSAEVDIELDDELKSLISTEIETNFQRTRSFSVRSSSMIEDGENSSFAGQFETLLNVTKDNLYDSILKCLYSMYSPNVLDYAKERGIDIANASMSVIVQEMVDADVSGVVFTANPQGLLNEIVVVVGKGTGNNVVEDKVDVTTYYYNKTDSNYYYEKQRDSVLLEDDIFIKLINICKEISNDEYIDLEFAISGGEIYILQTRPITTIKLEKLVILDNSNIVESYPGITLPLTYSFIHIAYTGVFRNVIHRVLKNRTQTENYDPIFKEMIGTVNGRVYYKISNWYTLIKLLPFSKKTLPIWQDMMGVKIKDVNEKDISTGFWMTAKIYTNSLLEYLQVPKNMAKLQLEFTEINNYFTNLYNPNLSNNELKQLYCELTTSVLDNWGITLLNDGYAFMFTGLLKSRFRKLKIMNYEQVTNDYISGITNIESMKPIKELVGIANAVIAENKRTVLAKLTDDDEVLEYLKTDGVVEKMITNYINNYGDRAMEELKLESPTFRSSPILLIRRILEYTSDEEKLATVTDSFNKSKPIVANNVIGKSNYFERKLISFLSKQAVKGINNREISRLNRSRLYGMARTIFTTIATNLKNEGYINDVSDVFYLTIEEIFSYIDGNQIDLMEIVNNRKHDYQSYEQLPSYSRLVFGNHEFNKTHKNINAVQIIPKEDRIIGTPCSNGVAIGEVVIINNPKEVIDVKDKILVTKMTDPGWVFLLTMAKGIIAEKGSLLSHTAIISRELKIPSVVGVDNITSILKTGNYVKIDGNTGIVEKMEK